MIMEDRFEIWEIVCGLIEKLWAFCLVEISWRVVETFLKLCARILMVYLFLANGFVKDWWTELLFDSLLYILNVDMFCLVAVGKT